MIFAVLLLLGFAFGSKEYIFEIKIGSTDPQKESTFWYGVSFADVADVVSSDKRKGLSFSRLHLYTGPSSPLEVVVQSLENIPQAQKVAYIPVDKNKNSLFDEGDSIYFVGQGPDRWQGFNKPNNDYGYYWQQNLYSAYKSYYFVLEQGLPLHISSLNLAVSNVSSKFGRGVHYEKDDLLRDNFFATSNHNQTDDSTGVEWMWKFIPRLTTATYNLSSLISESNKEYLGEGRFSLSFHPQRKTRTDGRLWGDLPLKERFQDILFTVGGFSQNQTDSSYLSHGVFHFEKMSSNEVLQVNNVGQAKDLRLNAFSFFYEKSPELDKVLLPLSSKEHSISVNKTCLLLENGEAIASLPIGNWKLTLTEKQTLFCPSKANKAPLLAVDQELSGSNIISIDEAYPQSEYLIVTSKEFLQHGQTLAHFRENLAWNKYSTSVVSIDAICKKYGFGTRSPIALRNFLQHYKSQNSSFRYLLLLGDGHFDLRNHLGGPPQVVPFFEREDLAADDFFALLDEGENLTYTSYDLDISVGRLPIANDFHFGIYMDKLMAYAQKVSQGIWRNRFLVLTDDFRQGGSAFRLDPVYGSIIKNNEGEDAYTGNHHGHVEQAEGRAKQLLQKIPSLNQKRLHLEDYSESINGEKPQAQQDLVQKWNSGNLISLYYGHGGSNKLADENLLDDNGVSQMKGPPTIFLAFSCIVGRIDRLSGQSLTEKMLWQADGGAIATISAMRESFSASNDSLSSQFFASLYQGKDQTLGDALRAAKQYWVAKDDFKRHNAERYNLFGEPVLAIPHERLKITLDQKLDTLQALAKVELSGTVSKPSGILVLRVEQQPIQKRLEWDVLAGGEPEVFEDILYSGRLLYEERIPFKNGSFSSSWISPQKLSFGDTNAQISIYAWEENSVVAGRYLQNGIKVWGTSSYADSIVDTNAPTIEARSCFQRSSQQTFGATITLNSGGCLEFVVQDSTGIDFVESPDEGISVEVLDLQAPYHPTFLEQNGRKAVFRHYFTDTTGVYTLRVKGSDILGNFLQKDWTVSIDASFSNTVTQIYNIPNPMKKYTRFHFQQNENGRALLRIFNQKGKLLKTFDPVVPGVTEWNGRDEWGNLQANGLYYYALEFNGKQAHRQKLVISR